MSGMTLVLLLCGSLLGVAISIVTGRLLSTHGDQASTDPVGTGGREFALPSGATENFVADNRTAPLGRPASTVEVGHGVEPAPRNGAESPDATSSATRTRQPLLTAAAALEIPEGLRGEWHKVRGPAWVKSLTVLPDGTLFADLVDRPGRQRGRLTVSDRNLASIQFGDRPDLDLQGRFYPEASQVRILWRGEELVLARADYADALQAAGPTQPAGPVVASDPGGGVPRRSAGTVVAPPGGGGEPNYGPEIRGPAFLLLGEWGCNVNDPASAGRFSGFISRMSLIEDGRAIYLLRRPDGTEGAPVVGSYQVSSDDLVEFRAPFLPGGSWTARFRFVGGTMIVVDAASGAPAAPGAFFRISGNEFETALKVPGIALRDRQADGEITLEDGLRTGLLRLERTPQPERSVTGHELDMVLSATNLAYPGRLRVIVQPGLPVRSEPLQCWFVAGLNEIGGRRADNSANRITVPTSSGYPRQDCRLTFLPFSAALPRSEDGFPSGMMNALKYDDSMRCMRVPGLVHVLNSVEFAVDEGALDLAGRFLGVLWNEVDLATFRARYADPSRIGPHWRRAAVLLQEALSIQPTDDEPEADATGLWISTADDPAGRSPQQLSILQPMLPGLRPTIMSNSRLLVHRDGRFTLILPAPQARVDDRDPTSALLRLQGPWKRSGSTIEFTLEFTAEERNDLSHGNLFAQWKSFRARLSGNRMEYVGIGGGTAGITLEKFAFPEGPRLITAKGPEPTAGVPIAPAVRRPEGGGGSPAGRLPAGREGWIRLALTGDPAVGSRLAAARFKSVRAPILNARGDVGFAAVVQGKVFASEEQVLGVYRVRGEELSLLSENSRTALDRQAGVSIQVIELLQIDSSGRLVLEGTLAGIPARATEIESRTGTSGYAVHDGRSLDVLVAAGQTAPGPAGGVWAPLEVEKGVLLGGNDGFIFEGKVLTGTRTEAAGIWFGKSGDLETVYETNQPLADGRIGYSLSALPMGTSDIAVFGQFLEAPGSRQTRRGIWIRNADGTRLIAQDNQPLPGGPQNLSVSSLRAIGGNRRGDLLVDVGFHGGPSKSLWKYHDGAFQSLTVPATAGPADLPKNTTWAIERAVINGQGTVAAVLSANVGGRGFVQRRLETLWLWSGTEARMVLRADRIAGVPGTSAVSGLGKTLVMNAAGQVLLTPQGNSVWIVRPDGAIVPVVKAGETFDFGNGDRRVVTGTVHESGTSELAFESTGGEDGRRRCFDDAGNLAIGLAFDDGSSGVFIRRAPKGNE